MVSKATDTQVENIYDSFFSSKPVMKMTDQDFEQLAKMMLNNAVSESASSSLKQANIKDFEKIVNKVRPNPKSNICVKHGERVIVRLRKSLKAE